jgi:PAS domain S-box-containing protein
MNTPRTSFHGVALSESQRDILGMIATNHPLDDILDLAGNIQSVNPAGLKLKPHTAIDFIGHHFSHLVLEEDLERVSQHFSAARAGAPQRFEARVLDESGKLLTMDISNLPIMVNGEIVGVFGIARDISEQKHFERQLSFNASHDRLTGLLNRVSLEDRLILDCHISRRRKRRLAVMCIDLDGFKSINDSIGHYFGDQVLIEVAQRRNNFQWYTSDLNQRVCEHASLRNDLQKAIETQSFKLHYQPQVDARTGRVVGIEALLRWAHPEKGFISPAVFVPVAEDSGQIIPLSLWVLDTACAQLRQLGEQGITGISMAVNISPMHFQRGQFVQCVQAALEKHGLSGEQLELEITESLL